MVPFGISYNCCNDSIDLKSTVCKISRESLSVDSRQLRDGLWVRMPISNEVQALFELSGNVG